VCVLCSKLGLNAPKEKSKWKYMQKYYHKGAFYLDDDSVREATDVRLRSTDAPTLEDKFNKEALPKVMQVSIGAFPQSCSCFRD
jgi:microfibrillar-associated protein 1